MDWLANNEPTLRLTCFAVVLVSMGLWETLAPKRTRVQSRARRWPLNLGLVALNTVIVRLLFPVAAAGVAVAAQTGGWGLLNHEIFDQWGIGSVVRIVAAVVILDLAIYLQHVMFHAVPALWRLHRVHHVDLDLDVTSGARFHPVEIILSMVIKMGVVVALGAPPEAIIIFEILLNATAMFNHANAALPRSMDRVLRLFVVTPDMHRVHHSIRPHETNSNFGFNLPWWDRLLGTYRAQPQDGHSDMTIGVASHQDPKKLGFMAILALPFIFMSDNYSINR